MDKLVTRTRVLLCIASIFLVIGCAVCAFSPNTVLIGIGITVVGIILLIAALVPAVKVVRLRNAEKEERIRKLENEIESLKKKSGV